MESYADSSEQQCPKIKNVEPEMHDLSYDERMKIIENDANSLYAYCMKKGFSDNELKQCVSGLYDPSKTLAIKSFNDSKHSLIYIAVMVAIVSMIYASPKASSFVAAHYSLFAVKVILPYWNYGQLWNNDCLIYNEWLPKKEEVFDSKYCEYCSKIVKLNGNHLDRVRNISKGLIQKHYVLNNQPVIVEDSMKDESQEPLTMTKISELYQTNPFLTTSMGSCAYETNVGFNDTFYNFISAHVDGMLPDKWHVRWENCEPRAAKALRNHYSRPYFIPDMAQSSALNSFIVAKGLQSQVFEFYGTQDQGTWLTVVSGSIQGKLVPMDQCIDNFGCKVAEFVVNAGESLLFYPQRWTLKYEIVSDQETFIVSSGLIWDDFE